MDRYTQKEFIAAYKWLFGATSKSAKEVYKAADPDYIKSVIAAYKSNSRVAFWND